MRSLIKNKRADYAAIVFVVVLIFAIGVIFFFVNHFNNALYTELQTELNTPEWNTTEAYSTISTLKDIESGRLWDWAFLAVYLGCIVALAISAYATRISPIFYWIYVILGLTVLVAGVIMSNVWQDISADGEFVVTLTRFPVMNALLGSYYPLGVTFMIFIFLIILFGKMPGQQEGYT